MIGKQLGTTWKTTFEGNGFFGRQRGQRGTRMNFDCFEKIDSFDGIELNLLLESFPMIGKIFSNDWKLFFQWLENFDGGRRAA